MAIPASDIVNFTPGVLPAGGLGLTLNGVILTHSAQVPIGTAQPFANADDVSAFFGPASPEFLDAEVYFGGFNNSTIKPGNLFFAQYNAAAVAAYLRGGPVTALTLAQLGLLSGSLTVLLDGYTHTASSINLTGSTSYTNAASIINTALFATEPTEATADAATIAGTVLTVGGTLTGTFAVGQTISGSSVTVGSTIISLGTGSGGAGTYNLSASSTVASPEAITAKATAGAVSFDSVSGGFVVTSGITGAPSTAAFATGTLAAGIFLTQATGAVLSQGAAAASPGPFMTALTGITQNWATFMTNFDPDGGSGNSVKLAFAEWNTLQNNRWAYVAWDTDASPRVTVPASSSLGQELKAANVSGTILISETTDTHIAAFVCGMIASINFAQRNGRITLNGKGQSGLLPSVTDQTTANNLRANGYNFYGEWATAAQDFIFFNPGTVSGEFVWADDYVNQIWLNSGLQLAQMLLITNTNSIPYTTAGDTMIEAAAADMIAAGLNFGAFSPGVVLSAAQQAEVNAAAGVDVISALNAQGYYFQVLPAAPSVRRARTSPPINFWYADGGAVQMIDGSSTAIQ